MLGVLAQGSGYHILVVDDGSPDGTGELADALGYKSHGFIGDLESGRKHPSLELAVAIADYFGVSVDQLARDELEVD